MKFGVSLLCLVGLFLSASALPTPASLEAKGNGDSGNDWFQHPKRDWAPSREHDFKRDWSPSREHDFKRDWSPSREHDFKRDWSPSREHDFKRDWSPSLEHDFKRDWAPAREHDFRREAEGDVAIETQRRGDHEDA